MASWTVFRSHPPPPKYDVQQIVLLGWTIYYRFRVSLLLSYMGWSLNVVYSLPSFLSVSLYKAKLLQTQHKLSEPQTKAETVSELCRAHQNVQWKWHVYL